MPDENAHLSWIPCSDKCLDVRALVGGRISAGRHRLRSAMPAQIHSDDAIPAFEERQLPAPVMRVASPAVEKHDVLSRTYLGREQCGRRFRCSKGFMVPESGRNRC